MANQEYIDAVKLLTNARRPNASYPLMLEVFATKCGPCVQQIPHLAALTAKYPTITIISCTGDTEDALRLLIAQNPEISKYNCGIFNGERIPGLMRAHNVRGTPHAFIFSESGKLVWQGHPQSCDAELDKLSKTVTRAFTGKGRFL